MANAADPPSERSTDSAPADITDEFLARVTHVLTEVMGPVAPRLIDGSRKRAETRRDLVAYCAEMIDQPNERVRFRALLAPFEG
jgi:hypothetical protein